MINYQFKQRFEIASAKTWLISRVNDDVKQVKKNEHDFCWCMKKTVQKQRNIEQVANKAQVKFKIRRHHVN